jgi:DNA-directed RNA polymerase subunit F
MIDILTEGGGLLGERDYTLMVDNSETMGKKYQDQDLWFLLENATLAIANRCEEYDFNGLSLYLYNDKFTKLNHVNAHSIAHAFEINKPSNSPYLAPPLQDAISNYFQQRSLGFAKPNGETIIVILGTIPLDVNKVEEILVKASHEISHDEELAVLFIQVGSDKKLTELLQKWDDQLLELGAKFDICDTVKITDIQPETLSELLLKAIID